MYFETQLHDKIIHIKINRVYKQWSSSFANYKLRNINKNYYCFNNRIKALISISFNIKAHNVEANPAAKKAIRQSHTR